MPDYQNQALPRQVSLALERSPLEALVEKTACPARIIPMTEQAGRAPVFMSHRPLLLKPQTGQM